MMEVPDHAQPGASFEAQTEVCCYHNPAGAVADGSNAAGSVSRAARYAAVLSGGLLQLACMPSFNALGSTISWQWQRPCNAGAAIAGAQSTSKPTSSTSSAAAPDADTATGPSSDASDAQDGSPPTVTTVGTSAPTGAPTAARTATNAPTAAKSNRCCSACCIHYKSEVPMHT
jgi:hypothetical protein